MQSFTCTILVTMTFYMLVLLLFKVALIFCGCLWCCSRFYAVRDAAVVLLMFVPLLYICCFCSTSAVLWFAVFFSCSWKCFCYVIVCSWLCSCSVHVHSVAIVPLLFVVLLLFFCCTSVVLWLFKALLSLSCCLWYSSAVYGAGIVQLLFVVQMMFCCCSWVVI